MVNTHDFEIERGNLWLIVVISEKKEVIFG